MSEPCPHCQPGNLPCAEGARLYKVWVDALHRLNCQGPFRWKHVQDTRLAVERKAREAWERHVSGEPVEGRDTMSGCKQCQIGYHCEEGGRLNRIWEDESTSALHTGMSDAAKARVWSASAAYRWHVMGQPGGEPMNEPCEECRKSPIKLCDEGRRVWGIWADTVLSDSLVGSVKPNLAEIEAARNAYRRHVYGASEPTPKPDYIQPSVKLFALVDEGWLDEEHGAVWKPAEYSALKRVGDRRDELVRQELSRGE